MITLDSQGYWWKHWEHLELEKTYLIVTKNTKGQRCKHEWELEFVNRGSRNYITNSAFLLLEIEVDSPLIV